MCDFVRVDEGRICARRCRPPREITDYRGNLLQRGNSPATINRRLVSLPRYFLWAKKQGMINDSPFEMLERVRVKEQKDVAPR